MRKEVIKSIKVYLCDPKVNTSCKKTSCFENNGPCYLSRYKENAIKGSDGFRYFYHRFVEDEEI